MYTVLIYFKYSAVKKLQGREDFAEYVQVLEYCNYAHTSTCTVGPHRAFSKSSNLKCLTAITATPV
jgi:hypothetical protein